MSDAVKDPKVGVAFQLESHRYGRTWSGAAADIAAQLRAEGVAAAVWAEPQSKVTAALVTAKPTQIFTRMAGIIPNLQEVVAEAARDCLRPKAAESEDFATRWADRGRRTVLLCAAWRAGATAVLRAWTAQAVELASLPDAGGMTGMGWACACGHATAVAFGIEQGLPLTATNRFGFNYTNLAASNGHRELARVLVASGAPAARRVEAILRSVGVPATAFGAGPDTDA